MMDNKTINIMKKTNDFWMTSFEKVVHFYKEKTFSTTDRKITFQKKIIMKNWFCCLCHWSCKLNQNTFMQCFDHVPHHIGSHILWSLSSPSFKLWSIDGSIVVGIGLISRLKTNTSHLNKINQYCTLCHR